MNARLTQQFILMVVLLLSLAWPASITAAAPPREAAAIRPAPAAVILADSWGVGKFVSSGGRARIVQVCAVVMSIALFIMMRKLN